MPYAYGGGSDFAKDGAGSYGGDFNRFGAFETPTETSHYGAAGSDFDRFGPPEPESGYAAAGSSAADFDRVSPPPAEFGDYGATYYGVDYGQSAAQSQQPQMPPPQQPQMFAQGSFDALAFERDFNQVGILS